MSSNPLLKKLGYSETDRLVIMHVDDIGMTYAGIQAFKDLWEFGTISSGAVMAPCPWFPAAAEMCRADPNLDVGVHATLNSEWDLYRWAPISTRDPECGLVDSEGYFPREPEEVQKKALPEVVAAELEAQVERALAAGIDVTHIDTHMGTITHPAFVQPYLQAGMGHVIPKMVPRASAIGFHIVGIDDSALTIYSPVLNQLEAEGVPMLDGLFAMPLKHDNDHIGVAKKLFSEIPEGITHFLFHPAIDTPELRASCPDWKARVANYYAFMSTELKAFIQGCGVHLIGYRPLREAMRGA